jgi:flavin reductase (DIM6/NTAB) family NADH-FMN oxidoreductase RutF
VVEIDPETTSARDLHALLTQLVIPRPIAWVSSLSGTGVTNLAPHSFFNVVSTTPPVVMFASGHTSRHHADRRKDTIHNIESTPEFVVHVVSRDLLDAMNQTSAEVAPEIDEFALAGLTKSPASRVRPPRIAEAKAALECRLRTTLVIGDNTLIFGDVVAITLHKEIYPDGKIDLAQLAPVGRLGGTLYAALGEILSLPRPQVGPKR